MASTTAASAGSTPVGVNVAAARRRAGLFGGSIPRTIDDPILRARRNIVRTRTERRYGPDSDFLQPNEQIFIDTSPRRTAKAGVLGD